MVVTSPRPAAPAAQSPAAPANRRRRSRRWVRLVLPTLLVLVGVVVCVVLYAVEQPSDTDPAYLSPVSSRPIGASKLADLLAANRVPVERVTKSSDALVSAYQGDAVLLITTPNLVHPSYLRMLKLLPATVRVVLVEPSDGTLFGADLPVGVQRRALAAKAVDPGCQDPVARAAGRAAVRRSVYFLAEDRVAPCYGGSYAVVHSNVAEVTVVGAADAFRNDRIGEYNNEALAFGLVGHAGRVVWLDLHRVEPPPRLTDASGPPGEGQPPSLSAPRDRPSASNFDFPVTPGNGSPTPRGTRGSGTPSVVAGQGGPNPLSTAFPPFVYPVTALILLGLALLGFARARRHGMPVTEPLPVRVRATETVEGRGRLYKRIKARARSLATLRTAALSRITRALDVPPDAERDDVVAVVAAQTGWPDDDIRDVLYDAEPDDDEQLLDLAVRLDALLHAVTAPGRAAPGDVDHHGETGE